MTHSRFRSVLAAASSEYGIVFALVALCVAFSVITLSDQHPVGAAAGEQLARQLARESPVSGRLIVVARASEEDRAFAEAFRRGLPANLASRLTVALGGPPEARAALDRIAKSGEPLGLIAATEAASRWPVFERLGEKHPAFLETRMLVPRSYRWPNFLKPENLLNIADQIAVIAIIAIGMTLVIISGGIDLSVGSLIALSAVVTALLIRDYGGAERASSLAMTGGSFAGILLCGGVGGLTGLIVTQLRIPPFIVTLGMMLVGSGLAFLLSRGQSVYQIPESFVWLGRGAPLGLPNAVILMVLLYTTAHLFMSRSRTGRWLYAVGSNEESARLSGVPVARVVWFAYVLSGLMAGLGGVVMASQLKSGSPTYGQMYELYVIAAVVVGGTSLSGGRGKVLGTLIGALVIAVIQNGMNLTGVESYTQKVVLGLVILGAVMMERLKRGRTRD